MTSKHLKPNQSKSILKLAKILIPVDPRLPSFAQTNVIEEVDRILDYLPKPDLSSLKMLLSLLNLLPLPLLRFFWLFIQKSKKMGGSIGGAIRQIDIGLKGIVYSLYYSDIDAKKDPKSGIYHTLEWRTKMQTIESENTAQPNASTALPTNEASQTDVNQCYERARAANRELRERTLPQRLGYIQNLKDVILADTESIITSIQKETRKSKTDCLMSEIFPALDHLDYLVKHAEKILQDEKVPTPLILMGKKSKIFYEPLGTALVISPWNYPFLLGLMPITTAFAVGNSVIYKPSEYTPLKGLVESTFKKAGFKADWLQVIYGDGKVGQMLIDGRPDKIFFTGSTATGSKIMAQAAKHLIPVDMELGGKDAMIVFDDVNLDRAVKGALWGCLTNSGQTCTSVEKLLVHENIYDAFKEKLVEEVERLVQSVDTDGSSDIGEMTQKDQVKIVAQHIEEAVSKGATLLTGADWNRTHSKIPPLVVENISTEMNLYKEETFGPVIPLYKFADEAAAIEMANDSEYGLNASVWSADIEKATRVARRLVTGNVSINNVMVTEGNAHLPFGGAKKSGIGRYKGRFGLYAFSNIKAVMIDKDSKKIEVNWHPYTLKKYKWFNTMMRAFFAPGLFNFAKFLFYGLWLEFYSTKVKRKLGK